MAPPNSAGSVAPKSAGAVANVRQQRWRHAEQAAQLVVPLAAADIEQQRARGVGCVGRMHLAAGEPPQQKRVDRAEGELARLRGRPRAGDMVEQPGDLAGGEIWIEQQPGLRGNCRLMAGAAQIVAGLRGAPVLPDDGVVDRLAAGAVPDDRGLALIGDADAGDVFGRKRRLWPSPNARWRQSPPRCPPGRARPGPAPDRFAAAPAAPRRAA